MNTLLDKAVKMHFKRRRDAAAAFGLKSESQLAGIVQGVVTPTQEQIDKMSSVLGLSRELIGYPVVEEVKPVKKAKK